MNGGLEVALRCAERGWWVHPLLPGSKRPAGNCRRCRPPSAGARPACGFPDAAGCACREEGRYCHGVRAATRERELIHRWWRGRDFGVGVAAGPSGLVVLDLDDHDRPPPEQALLLPGVDLTQHQDTDLGRVRSGVDVLQLLCRVRRAGSLLEAPATLTVQTRPAGSTCGTGPGTRAGTCRARVGSGGRSTYGPAGPPWSHPAPSPRPLPDGRASGEPGTAAALGRGWADRSRATALTNCFPATSPRCLR